MPKEFIYEPWKAPLSIQVKAKCIVGKDYPKPGSLPYSPFISIYSHSSCFLFLSYKRIISPISDTD